MDKNNFYYYIYPQIYYEKSFTTFVSNEDKGFPG